MDKNDVLKTLLIKMEQSKDCPTKLAILKDIEVKKSKEVTK